MNDERSKLEIAKLRAELISVRIDMFLKPFQIVITIIIALGIFLLVQRPEQEESRISACLEQVQFMRGVASEEKDPEISTAIIAAFENFEFQCDAARTVASALSARQTASNTLVQVRNVVNLIPDIPYFDLQQIENVERFCSATETTQIQEAAIGLPSLVSELEARRVEVETAIARLTEQADIEMMTGAGPRYNRLLDDISTLNLGLVAINAELQDAGNQLEFVREFAQSASLTCSQ